MIGPTTAEIKAAAIAAVADIAASLAPDMARVDGHIRWSLNPTRPDTSPNSFCIDVAGAAPGRFKEFASGEGGDVIDFVSYCLAGGAAYQTREARGAAFKWLREFLGFQAMSEADRAAVKALAAERDKRAEAARHEAKAERARKAKFAAELWFKARPWPGTPVETYLTRARGLPVAAIGSPLSSIRYEPEAACGVTGEIMPAMLTAFSNARGRITGVHTTFLDRDTGGKAKIERAKRFMGDCRGAVMRLHRGRLGVSDVKASRDGMKGDVLAIAEGIENALSWAFLAPDHRVWAAGAIDMIGRAPIPSCVSEIIVLRDNDAPGSAAEAGLIRARDALLARAGSRRVRIQAPPKQHKDFNDWWRSL